MINDTEINLLIAQHIFDFHPPETIREIREILAKNPREETGEILDSNGIFNYVKDMNDAC
jgi:hypothetical protein